MFGGIIREPCAALMFTPKHQPYPYERLARLTRPQIALHAYLRARGDATDDTRPALELARSLLGAELSLTSGESQPCSGAQVRARLTQRGASLVLRLELRSAALPVPWLLELSNHDAQQLVDRALGGEGGSATAPPLSALDELACGALAYVSARILAAAGGELTLREISALPLDGSTLPEGAWVVWPWHVQLADQLASLRLYVPESSPLPALRARPVVRTLAALPLELSASAGRISLPLSAARTLGLGDVLLLDDTGLAYEQGELCGRVRAGLPGREDLLTCELETRGLRIVGCSPSARIKEPRMTTGRIEDTPQGLVTPELAAETTLELRVEVARFSLTLAELQRLTPGDVLVTGRRIGERVQLRVAQQAFAEGELVDVEGELGVKLLSFSGG